VLCDFKVFTQSKIVQKLMLKNIAVFPIDLKKVPFLIQSEVNDYKDYLKLLTDSTLAVVKSGK
jgi:hypothetical protein